MTLVVANRIALAGRLTETSLTLAAGELVCLIGPNGSGKTSLLHALAGIGRPSGEVHIDGMDPRGLSPARRQRLLSYLPATREVGWPLTATDLIALGTPAPDPAEEIGALLSELDLADMGERRVDRLSTGERSRVLIARALVARPKLLLLDEPIANLDPRWQLKLMAKLRSDAQSLEQAVLVAVHDLDIARAFADRLIIMDRGRIAADGPPHILLDGPHIPAVFGIERAGAGWRPL